MVKIEHFTIRLTKENPIYSPGEELGGDLFLRVNERLKINSLKLDIIGAAKVQWDESTIDKNKNGNTQRFLASEVYFNFDFVFISEQDTNDLYLETGNYSYPFNVKLSNNIPTSFQHKYGVIGYSVNGTLNIPWSSNKNTSKSFTVVNHLDLNSKPNLRQPYNSNDTRIVCCWCCKNEPIIATLTVQKGGYVPGENIVFSFTIENNSSRRIKSISVTLYQKIEFHAYKTKSIFQKIAKMEFNDKIESNGRGSRDNECLLVPSTCSSSNGLCHIIDVNYFLQFHYYTNGLHCKFYNGIKIPITIGTIPLRNEGMQSDSFSYPQCSYEPASIIDGQGSENNMDLPPAYDALVGEMVESNANSFKPQYPYYKNFN